MRFFLFLIAPSILGLPSSLLLAQMKIFVPDFSTFEKKQTLITRELDSLTPAHFKNHPEYGRLPADAPDTDYVELVQKRTFDSRYYIKKGSGGRVFYVQNSYGDFNYPDSNGWIRSIDPELLPCSQFIYRADHQPVPALLDMSDGSTALKIGALSLSFNKSSRVYHVTSASVTDLFGNISLAGTSVGKNGAKSINAWPGINREIVFGRGNIETNFILNAPPVLSSPNGYLAFHDEITLPGGYALIRDTLSGGAITQEGYWQGGLKIINLSTSAEVARWAPVFVYDNSGNRSAIIIAPYQVINNGNTYFIRVMVKTQWLTDPARVYPVTVDPLVSGSNTWSAGAIGFTAYAPGNGFCGNSSAWCLGGPLNVTFPGQATITNVLWGATYTAVSPAFMSDGGFRITGPCGEDPSNPNNWWSCGPPGGNAPGNCVGSGINSPALATCLAPQCAASVLAFRLKNIDCFAWDVPCSTAFLFTANGTWTVSVQGQTVAQPAAPVSSAGTTICNGQITLLTATGQYGVPPYTYSWSPGAMTPQSVNVAPTITTTYTCVITDACGVTALNIVTITVTNNSLTPAPVITSTMSPPSGSPCPVTVTFCTNVGSSYGAGSESYVWSFPGGTVTAGGATSGSAPGPTYGGTVNGGCSGGSSYVVSYASAGSYWASVSITSGGNCTTTNVAITVCGALPIDLISFTAKRQNNIVLLDWVTASEENNDYFLIERSLDGASFIPVVKIKGAGNSYSNLSYRAVDESPPPEDIIYYRLKQTDFDGKYSYSKIVAVYMEENGSDVYIRPNPVLNTAEIGFVCDMPGNVLFRLFDTFGRIIRSKEMGCSPGRNSVNIDLTDIPPGIYFVKIISDQGEKQKRFIKK